MRSLLFGGVLALALALATSPPALADPLPDALAQLNADFDAAAIAPVAVPGYAADALEATAPNTVPGTLCIVEFREGTDTPTSILDPVSLAAPMPRLRPPNVSESTSDSWAYFGRPMRLASAEHIDRSRFDPAAISLRRSAV